MLLCGFSLTQISVCVMRIKLSNSGTKCAVLKEIEIQLPENIM